MPFMNSVERVYAFATLPQAIVIFNYPNFSSTTGLTFLGTAAQSGSVINMTTAVDNQTGNLYRTTALQYNKNFSFEWNFECSGGPPPTPRPPYPADGFCLQWITTNSSIGAGGGGVGYVSSAAQAFTFLTYTNNSFTWYKNNVAQTTQGSQNFYRNLFFWADYNHATSTMRIYFDSTSTKPVTPNFTLTGFSFDATPYYIGFGAATGGENEDHILRSMKLTFT
jgi:hypothetical protein